MPALAASIRILNSLVERTGLSVTCFLAPCGPDNCQDRGPGSSWKPKKGRC